MPGFLVLFPEGFGGVPMLQARGFFGAGEAEYVQLRVDGVPLADARVRGRGLAAPCAPRRWRASRGYAVPGSALYGDTALAGVIRRPHRRAERRGGPPRRRPRPLGGRASAPAPRTSTCDNRSARVDLEVHAATTSTDGYRRFAWSDETPGRARGLGAGRRRALAADGRWRGSASAASPVRSRLRSPRAIHARPTRCSPTIARSARCAAPPWSGTTSGAGSAWRATLYAAERESEFLRTLLIAAGLGDRTRRDLDTDTLGASLEMQAPLGGAGDVRLGVEGARDRLDTRYRSVDEEARAGDVVAAARVRRERGARLPRRRAGALGARTRVAAALRYDRVGDETLDGRRIHPHRGGLVAAARGRAAAGRRDGAARRLRAGGARLQGTDPGSALRSAPLPRFRRRHLRDLQPAARAAARRDHRGRSVAGRPPAGAGSWSRYRTDVEDEIDFDPATFRYVNIGASRHDGGGGRGLAAALQSRASGTDLRLDERRAGPRPQPWPPAQEHPRAPPARRAERRPAR